MLEGRERKSLNNLLPPSKTVDEEISNAEHLTKASAESSGVLKSVSFVLSKALKYIEEEVVNFFGALFGSSEGLLKYIDEDAAIFFGFEVAAFSLSLLFGMYCDWALKRPILLNNDCGFER